MLMDVELRDQVWDLAEDFSSVKQSDPFVYSDTGAALAQKIGAGFNVSYNDVYGRGLSYHLMYAPPIVVLDLS